MVALNKLDRLGAQEWRVNALVETFFLIKLAKEKRKNFSVCSGNESVDVRGRRYCFSEVLNPSSKVSIKLKGIKS